MVIVVVLLYTRNKINGNINIKLLEGTKLKIDRRKEDIIKAELVKFKDGECIVMGDDDIDKYFI